MRFAVYDIETLGLEPNNFLYGIVYYKPDDYKVFTDRKSMLNEMIQRKNKGKVFFAHNCEYDLTGLIPQNLFKFFPQYFIFQTNPLYRGSNFISAKYHVFRKRKYNKVYREYVYFWDSYRILLSSLKRIGEILGFEKISTPTVLKNPDGMEYNIFNECFNLTPELIEYCLKDCEILYMALNNFQDFIYNNFGVGLRSTISSIAFSIWKHNYLKNMWNDCNFKPNYAFKRSYYGGRVEVFRWGKSKNVNAYDVNSLYPYVAFKDYPHPYKLYYTTTPDVYKNYEGCGLFDVYAPDMNIPILPYRYNQKLIFPIGKFNSWYNFNEIRYAEENGYEVKLKYGYFSYERTSPLKEYMEDIYKFRKKYDKNDYRNLILKYLLNSLYGRFGLKIENKEYMYDHEFWNSKDSLWKTWDFVCLTNDGYGYAINRSEPYYLSESTYIALPSYLTSYARIHLHKHLHQHDSSILYCDTDSLYLDSETLPDDMISDDLGKWKFEGNFENIWFLGCKFYITESDSDLKVKLKGINFKDKLNKIEELPNTYEIVSYFKNREALRRNENVGSKKILDKSISPYVYDKRIYDSSIDYLNESTPTYPITI